jgi:NTE family protein
MFDAMMGSSLIMQQAILQERLRHRPPTLYVKPQLCDIRVLDFDKADTIYRQTASAREVLRQRLLALR